MKLRTPGSLNLRGKKILLRTDINSPVVNGKVLDSPRFSQAAHTIKKLSQKGARIVILAHQGRKGGADFLSLEQHARILSRHTGKKIRYVDGLFDKNTLKKINSLKNGESILLKNVRSFSDEVDVRNKKNRYLEFCKTFDIYINDAFSVSHRNQGSLVIPPKIIPAFAGWNLASELNALKKFHLLSAKKTAFLLGGSKAKDYIPLFKILKDKSNKILASGIIANLFLIAKGCDLGYEKRWLRKKGYFSLIPKLRMLCKKYGNQIVLPVDFALSSPDIRKAKKRIVKNLSDAPFSQKIWDVDKRTVELFEKNLKGMKSILMKGPLGYSELKQFSNSTVDILKFLSRQKAFTLIGGGHLSTTIEEYHIPNRFSHVSTSGGALIAYLAGEKLPGLTALEKSAKSK